MQHCSTLKELAALAKVSLATASLALRNSPMASPETCRRIQQLARKVGYVPHAAAVALASGCKARTPAFHGSLALLTCDDLGPDAWRSWTTHVKLTEGAKERAKALGYHLEDFWLLDPAIPPRRLQQILLHRGIPGLIFNRMTSTGEKLLRLFNPRPFACAALGWRFVGENYHSATNDQFQSAALATSALRERGYRRIGLLLDATVDSGLGRRFLGGYLSQLDPHSGTPGIPIFTDLWNPRALAEWIRGHSLDALLSLPYPFHTVVRDAGFSIPDDLAFAYLDVHADDPLFGNCAGVDQHHRSVGAAAVDLVVAQIHRRESGPPDRQKNVLIESTWVDGWSAPQRGPSRRKQRKRPQDMG